MSEVQRPPGPPDAADALWAFAVAVYGRPGVGAACLALQDRAGANVPLLLFALWLGAERGIALTGPEAEAIDREVGPWHQEIVAALRALRRRLKDGPLPAPGAATDALRETIKAAELAAERIELDTLARIAEGRPRDRTRTPSAATAAANLAAMLGSARSGEDGTAEAAAILVAALEPPQ